MGEEMGQSARRATLDGWAAAPRPQLDVEVHGALLGPRRYGIYPTAPGALECIFCLLWDTWQIQQLGAACFSRGAPHLGRAVACGRGGARSVDAAPGSLVRLPRSGLASPSPAIFPLAYCPIS